MKPRLLLLSLLAIAPVAGAQRASDVASLRAVVEHAFAAFEPVGLAVAVVDGEDVVLAMGLGVQEKGDEAPVTADTAFNIASCTKAFTAACIGKLVAEGKIGWDDPVVGILPEFRLADPWITRQMTVRDLLCHRSGLKTFEGDLLWYGSDYTDAEIVARLDRLPITRRFREEFGYQNLLYMVAGLVVERVAGESWSDYVRSELLEPLGMTRTSPGASGLPEDAAVARPHIDGAPIDAVRFGACKPAGAIWSSAADMARWVRMLLADGAFEGRELVAPGVLHTCWTPHTMMPGGRDPAAIEDFNSYGLGWFLAVLDGKKLVEHDGGMPGFLSKVTLVPADRFGLVVLNNSNDGVLNLALRLAIMAQRSGGDGKAVIDRYAAFAKARAQGEEDTVTKREASRHEGTSPSLALDAYAGRYEDPLLGSAEVTRDGDELKLVVIRSADHLHGKLTHWHHDVFRVDFPDRFLPFALIRFSLDVEGAVDGFRIDCPIADFDFAALDFRRAKRVR